MAVLNPQVPDAQEPNYAFWARPIKQPQPSKVGEEIGKGIADVAHVGLRGADFVHKTNIDNELHQKFDEIVADTKSSIGSVEDSLLGDKASGKGPDLTDLNTQLSKLSSLKEFGKLSVEAYDARLDAAQSSIRARYPNPEDRDLIDATAEKYYRQDPANRTIRAQLGVLNALSSGANAEERRFKDEALKSGNYEAYQAYEKNPTKEMRLKVEDLVGRFYKTEADAKNAKANIEIKKAKGEDVAIDTGRMVDQYLSEHMSLDFDKIHVGAGMDLAEMMRKKAKGELDVPPDVLIAYSNAVLARANQFRLDASRKAQQENWPRDLGPKGQEEFANKLEAAVKPYEEFARDVTKPGGMVLSNLELSRYKNDAFVEWARANMTYSELALRYKGTRAGEKFEQMSILKESLTPEMLARTAAARANILGVQDSSFADLTHEANDPKTKISPAEGQRIVRQTLDDINTLPEQVKDAIKTGDYTEAAKIADYAFNPKNFNIVNQFAKEGKGPDGKEIRQGKYTVFDRLTNPQLGDAAFKLAQHGHPESWQNYTNLTMNEGRNLIQEELDSLQHFQDTPEWQAGRGPFRNTYVTWDDKSSNWIFNSDIPSATSTKRSPKGFETTRIHTLNPNSFARDRLEATVNRANHVLDNLKVIPQNEGKDVNGFLLGFMINQVGLDPNSRGLRFSDGFIQSMRSTILKTQGQPTEK